MSNNNMIVIVPNPNQNEEGAWYSIGNWADKNKTSILTTAVTTGAGLLLKRNPYFAIGAGIVVVGGCWALNQWRSTDDTFFSEITETESQKYQCQSGHFQQKVLYIKHPFRDIYYYSMADFHRKLFEEKYWELYSLLVALGATEIDIQHVQGFSTSANIKGGDNSFTEIRAEAEKTRSSNANCRLKLPGHAKPYIPVNLIWFKNEAAWQKLAASRIDHGLSEGEIDLNYLEDYNVNAGLKSKIESIKISAGGRFTEYNETSWKIRVKFHPM